MQRKMVVTRPRRCAILDVEIGSGLAQLIRYGGGDETLFRRRVGKYVQMLVPNLGKPQNEYRWTPHNSERRDGIGVRNRSTAYHP
jgi:hypothetical protein